MENKNSKNKITLLIIICVLINFSIGTIAKAIGLPIYLDSIGTIIATLLLGRVFGAITGVAGFAMMSILQISPLAFCFSLTQIAIALTVYSFGKRGFFTLSWRIVVSGLAVGFVAAVMSAPVIVLVFDGATGNGAVAITGIFTKMGHKILEAVIFSGSIIEPMDKILQCWLAVFILNKIPKSKLPIISEGLLKENKFIS